MTKNQLRRKVKKMHADAIKIIDREVERAINSTGINLDEYHDNYELPKIVLSAAGQEIKWQYEPVTQYGRDVRDNLIDL